MDLPSLNFKPGRVQAAIWSRFGDLVSPSSADGCDDFILVVSFGRCKFKLTEQSVDLILQATLGGEAADFRPKQLSDGVFHFLVASRRVGFHIVNIRSFSCSEYKLFFHLWGDGGLNWKLEFKKKSEEEAAQWSPVLHR
jgi:hypothetical protein